MNISALTAKEVMRICQPETELERRLFEIVGEIQSELEDAVDECDNAIDALESDSFEDEYESLKQHVMLAIRDLDGALRMRTEDAERQLKNVIDSLRGAL